MGTTESTASVTEATASTTSSSLLSDKQNFLWFWQSNPNPWDQQEQKEWKRYSDFENDHIEQAFQQKQKNVELNDYMIDFEWHMQFNKNDRERQRSIERRQIDVSQYVREERFSYPIRATNTFDCGWNKNNDFQFYWEKQNEQIIANENYAAIAELAAKGILKEGELLNKTYDAQRMAAQLRDAATKSKEELCSCAARLYTAETFLYKLVIASQRNKDTSKADTLGPFSYLLSRHLHHSKDGSERRLYRGMKLTDDMMEEYNRAAGQWIVWPAYISTTKDRRVAEQFGNALVIMDTMNGAPKNRSDVSHLSYYPHEQEVLLDSFIIYGITKIERPQSANGKYIISMKAVV